jgi:hypothetical protein
MLDHKENLALRIGAIMHNMESLCGPAVRETRSDEASNACNIATGFPGDVINHMAERWTSHLDSGADSRPQQTPDSMLRRCLLMSKDREKKPDPDQMLKDRRKMTDRAADVFMKYVAGFNNEHDLLASEMTLILALAIEMVSRYETESQYKELSGND